MNHLRDLIECIDDGRLRVADISLRDVVGLVRIAMDHSICFDMGSYGHSALDNIKPVESLAVLPYWQCWFEIESDGSVIGTQAAKQDDDSYVSAVFLRKGREWALIAYYHTKIDVSDGVVCNLNSEHDTFVTAFSFYPIRQFLTAMNCSNVRKVETLQPEKLQKARAKRGKKPLFSYWTLELKQDRAEGESLGGTHSSPRLHLRRGHPRQYAPNKWTWVQPCVVGNKSLGMVHKDYRLADLPHN